MSNHTASDPIDAVVAGHICLDIIPAFAPSAQISEFRPGALYHVGPALRSTGGAVANTGIALHRLGLRVALMGKVGDDLFGRDILDLVGKHSKELTSGMKISPGETSSYTVVISPPGIDRTFLHCPGCNDTFTGADLNEAVLSRSRLLHFGYPPLMRSMYGDGGSELLAIMQRAKALGLGTSLDMAFPDPSSEAGRVNWSALLRKVLPAVDVFMPSIEELLYMLDRPTWDTLMRKGRIEIAHDITREMLYRLSGFLLDMGAAIVMIKLGDQGAYLRTSTSIKRIDAMGKLKPSDTTQWVGCEAIEACFAANLVGTTGSGDCTIAGFLCALLRGMPAKEALRFAVAVGACSVEQADATSGVPRANQVQQRIASGWRRLSSQLSV